MTLINLNYEPILESFKMFDVGQIFWYYDCLKLCFALFMKQMASCKLLGNLSKLHRWLRQLCENVGVEQHVDVGKSYMNIYFPM